MVNTFVHCERFSNAEQTSFENVADFLRQTFRDFYCGHRVAFGGSYLGSHVGLQQKIPFWDEKRQSTRGDTQPIFPKILQSSIFRTCAGLKCPCCGCCYVLCLTIDDPTKRPKLTKWLDHHVYNQQPRVVTAGPRSLCSCFCFPAEDQCSEVVVLHFMKSQITNFPSIFHSGPNSQILAEEAEYM